MYYKRAITALRKQILWCGCTRPLFLKPMTENAHGLVHPGNFAFQNKYRSWYGMKRLLYPVSYQNNYHPHKCVPMAGLYIPSFLNLSFR